MLTAALTLQTRQTIIFYSYLWLILSPTQFILNDYMSFHSTFNGFAPLSSSRCFFSPESCKSQTGSVYVLLTCWSGKVENESLRDRRRWRACRAERHFLFKASTMWFLLPRWLNDYKSPWLGKLAQMICEWLSKPWEEFQDFIMAIILVQLYTWCG